MHCDIPGNTVEKLAVAESGIPRHIVCRAVDDRPVTTPGNSTWGQKFVTIYKNICKELNIELAEDCEDYGKAFSNTKRGKVVLGVRFYSINQAWRLPGEKVLATRIILRDVVSRTEVGLNEMQSLLNRLNFVCMMCPVLKAFRYNMNRELARRIEDPSLRSVLSKEAKADLLTHDSFPRGYSLVPDSRRAHRCPCDGGVLRDWRGGVASQREVVRRHRIRPGCIQRRGQHDRRSPILLAETVRV